MAKVKVAHRINLPLIKKVLAHIKKDVRRLEMTHWGTLWKRRFADWNLSKAEIVVEKKDNHVPPCHTTACFAGWTAILTTPKKEAAHLFAPDGHMVDVSDQAAKALGLSDTEADMLFDGDLYGPPKEQYKRVVGRVNYLLEKNGIKERVK